MALVTPIVGSISAFDATTEKTFTFIANGGDQIVKNEIKIVTNDANETVVYQNTVVTFALSQVVPANSLTNGTYYKVAFKTYDSLNNDSAWSNYQPFYCYSTPTLNFNVSDGQTVYSQNFTLTLTYNQIQGEKLDYATIRVYNHHGTLIENSGNLYNDNNPPISFSYQLNSLENHTDYTIIGTAVTVNNTLITTGNITFTTNYQIVENGSELYYTVDNCNGYVNVRSAPVINGNTGTAQYYPSVLPYIDNAMVDLVNPISDINYEYADWVRWYDFAPVRDEMLIRLWFYPARQPFDILKLESSNSSEYLNISLKRGSSQDYLSIRTNSGTIIDHGLGVFCNGTTKVFLWVNILGGNWDVRTEILENSPTVLEWNNSTNNARYNVTSGRNYSQEPYGTFVPSITAYTALNGDIDTATIGNGIFDEFSISLNTSTPYSSDVPIEDRSAVLTIHFNGSVENSTSGNYTKLLLRRKDPSTLIWWNIEEIEIPQDSSARIDYNDGFIPQDVTQTYSLVLYEGTTPSESYTIDVTPKWGRVFISDKDEHYGLNYAVIYSGHSQNIQNGIFMPINAKYPVVVQNANGNYRSGSLQFKILGYQFEIDKTLDRTSMTVQLNDMLAFLTNGKAKCIKDYNGNIFICKVINSPQISFDGNWGNGIPTVSFDWVEQTEYNNYEGMTELGLIDVIN